MTLTKHLPFSIRAPHSSLFNVQLFFLQHSCIRDNETAAVTSVRSEADEWYRSNPNSFYNYPVEDMSFVVGQTLAGDNTPNLYLGEKTEGAPGITHLTPPACSMYSKTRMEGNFGDVMSFRSGSVTVDQPSEVAITVGLSSEPVAPGAARNVAVHDYFDWLQRIEELFVAHLVDNLDAYPVMEKQYGVLRDAPETLANMLRAQTRASVRTRTAAPETEGDEGEATRFMTIKQKLYRRLLEEQKLPRPKCELDEQFGDLGYARRHVPVYDARGDQLELSEYGLRPRDVFIAESTVNVSLFEVAGNTFFGLRPSIKSLVLVHRSKYM